MASHFRSNSPVAAATSAERSKADPFLGQGNGNGLRKSFNVNVLPRAPSSRISNQSTFTPANSPADYSQKASPFKDSSGPAWRQQSEEMKEIGIENVRPGPKTGKSPATKGMRNFMAPTFSAAVKATSPKKRVLAERNEAVCPSPSLQQPAKTPAKSPSVIARPHFSDPPVVIESEAAPVKSMEVDPVGSAPKPKNNDVCRSLFEENGACPEPSEGSESLAFLAQFPDPGDECTSPLPPYDPKKNYLSPRPQFLRYRPNRGLDVDDSIEIEDGFGRHKFFKSESPAESGVTETKEVEFLGDRMASVGISPSKEVGCGEIHEEVQTKMVSVESSEERVFENPDMGLEPKKNDVEEMDPAICEEEEEDEDEEEQERGSRWLRRSLSLAFVFLCASLSVLASDSPGLLPASLHSNAVARGYSRLKYGVTVKNVKVWLDSSVTRPKMPTKSSSMEDVLKNPFENVYTKDIDESGKRFGLGIDMDNDAKSYILPSELLEGESGGEDIKVEESSTEAILEVRDMISVSLVSNEQSTQITDAEDSHILDTELTELNDLHENPEVPFSSELQEIVSNLKEPLSFFVGIEEEKEAPGRTEDYLTEVQPEEAQSVSNHASTEGNLGDILETIIISDPEQVPSSTTIEDSHIDEESYLLNKQSRASYAAEEFESTESDKHSISQSEASVPEESSLPVAEDIKDFEVVEASSIPRRLARELLSSGTMAILSILVAAVIAAFYYASASRKSSKRSGEEVAQKPSVEFIAKKDPRGHDYSPPVETMDKPYSRMNFTSPSLSSPTVEFLTEYLPGEVSSLEKNAGQMNAAENSFHTYQRRSRRGNTVSSGTPQDYAVTSEFSTDSPSYGSFTTYEKIALKEGGVTEEQKVMKVVTPVRRSSRIRKQVMSPQ